MNRSFPLMVALAVAGSHVPASAELVPSRARSEPPRTMARFHGEGLSPLELHNLSRKNARRRKRR